MSFLRFSHLLVEAFKSEDPQVVSLAYCIRTYIYKVNPETIDEFIVECNKTIQNFSPISQFQSRQLLDTLQSYLEYSAF